MTELERIAKSLESLEKNFQLIVSSMVPSEEIQASQKAYDTLYINNNMKEQEIREKELRIRDLTIEKQLKNLELEQKK